MKSSCLIGVIALLSAPSTFAQQSHSGQGSASKATQLSATESASINASGGASYQDTVKWIQDHIGDAGFPAVTETSRKSGIVLNYDDAGYSVKFDGCNMHLNLVEHMHQTDTTPIHANDQTDSDTSLSATIILPLDKIQYVPTGQIVLLPQEWTRGALHPGYVRQLPTVSIILPDTGIGTMSYTWSTTDDGIDPKNIHFVNKIITAGTFPTSIPGNFGTYIPKLGIQMTYARPGTEDAPQHMAKALQHLHELCRDKPNQVPKDLF